MKPSQFDKKSSWNNLPQSTLVNHWTTIEKTLWTRRLQPANKIRGIRQNDLEHIMYHYQLKNLKKVFFDETSRFWYWVVLTNWLFDAAKQSSRGRVRVRRLDGKNNYPRTTLILELWKHWKRTAPLERRPYNIRLHSRYWKIQKDWWSKRLFAER